MLGFMQRNGEGAQQDGAETVEWFLLTLENPPLGFYVFLVFGMKEVTAMGWSAWRPVASDGAKGDGLGASVRMSYLLGASGVQVGEGLERMSMLTAYHW